MNQANQNTTGFVPKLEAVLDTLADEIEGWANALGINSTYSDLQLQESGRNEWAADLRKQSDWALRTAVTLLTARGRADQAKDLKRLLEELFTAAAGYEQTLDAMEDQCRVHIEGIVSRYCKAFGDKDPDAAKLWGLCRGIQRTWTLRCDEESTETPKDFAEAIDRAMFEEDGAKRKARADLKHQASDLIEHLRLLAGVEGERAQSQEPVAEEGAKRGKRGPARMPLKEAWKYLTTVQEWADIQDRNRKLPMRDRKQKIQMAEIHGITVRELDAMLAWYAKHRRGGVFPNDPRTLSKDELGQWFE